MAIFASHDSYWTFAHSIHREYRHAFSDEAIDFLDRLGKKLSEDPAYLKKTTSLCRAQLGHDYRAIEDDRGNEVDQTPCAFEPERMKPLRDKAREGRVNPKGIPCLYLSTNRETAIAEVRPSKGAFVSLGYFDVIKDCKLANFSAEHKWHIVFENPPEGKIDEIVLGHLTYAFSRPVEIDDTTAEYAPTQVIAEYVRKIGYDGIYYRSDLGPGMNIALFDLDAAELRACDLFMVNGIKYSYVPVDNTYVISKKKDTAESE
jgi:hypothetical protein